ncbi:hypothetical protein T7987_15900 [Sulfitobacter faviae]|uniref:Uncharacterized protein n=1 Tax=Sulfitobacter faviae TaxID=1775881 RepID=A0ABZ0V153_9RHOB|nr:hypothetical protein [Sulfitobacter faviae]WPZ21626.1 hypothetical protein T7987_15900 [Sulfitobacter faviae]
MKHKAFTEIVAHSCRVPQKTVALFARNLKEAGLLTSGARGVNAPEMTVLDLTRMTIALCATDRPSEATDLTERYCAAECSESTTIEVEGTEIGLSVDDTLESVLSSILSLHTIPLSLLHPELAINWNTCTATLGLNGQPVIFKAVNPADVKNAGRGIITTRGIGGSDFLEMALPFYLEQKDGTTWESMVKEGRTRATVSKHIFGETEEGK